VWHRGRYSDRCSHDGTGPVDRMRINLNGEQLDRINTSLLLKSLDYQQYVNLAKTKKEKEEWQAELDDNNALRLFLQAQRVVPTSEGPIQIN